MNLSRYKLYELLIKKFNISNNEINCLEKTTGNIFELFYYNEVKYKYKLNKLNIYLLKVIGHESVMGTIYYSKYEDYYFVTKIIILNNFSIKELEITTILSNCAYKKNNIHLPLLYGHSLCNKIDNIKLKLMDYNPKNSYYCLFIELYNDTIYSLILFLISKKYYSIIDFIYNIILQCFISILSCHINNIYHNDSHINNFLYKLSDNKNYKSLYKYKYEDLEFYLLGFPYIISICDFGLSKMIDDDNKKFRNDYKILLDSINEYIISKYKINFNLDFFYEILKESNNDYELFKKLKENKFFYEKEIENKYEEIINLS